MSETRFIVYTNGCDAIICTPETEKEALAECFGPDSGRDLEQDWDREESADAVLVVRASVSF